MATDDVRTEIPRKNILCLRGSEQWRDWLHRLAEHCRANSTTVIDQALVKHARDVGFSEPPPKR